MFATDLVLFYDIAFSLTPVTKFYNRFLYVNLCCRQYSSLARREHKCSRSLTIILPNVYKYVLRAPGIINKLCVFNHLFKNLLSLRFLIKLINY